MKEFIYGRNPVYETLLANRRHIYQLQVAEGVRDDDLLNRIIFLVNDQNIHISKVPRQRLDHLGDNPQGIALEVSEYPYASLRDVFEKAESSSDPLFVLILDTLQDPQNLGTLIRSAESVGVHGVIIPTHRAAGITPAVVRTSAGATEHMLVVQSNLSQAISELKNINGWVVGLDESQDSLPPSQIDLDGPLVIVVGSEGEGLRAQVRKHCDFLMRLPMEGRIASLNASVAGSVALYLAYMARKKQQ
ncbi:MAG TPA: 23S rRNA (guanosine(2251)-2'-O)-methyltransferase RlmB [Anaerolineales bacterium]|nr:23S rRNA (guanosine(2251)-2'-O)-methyltransferase RlmB [Anaerolineales bacterium]